MSDYNAFNPLRVPSSGTVSSVDNETNYSMTLHLTIYRESLTDRLGKEISDADWKAVVAWLDYNSAGGAAYDPSNVDELTEDIDAMMVRRLEEGF
jgi:hypothetical protein